MTPVVVVGAGLAGLSAACYLTGRGYDVTVVERAELPGGRAGVLRQDGFTFDTGPTVLTMPDLITDAIRAATHDPSAGLGELLPMRRLDPAYRACFADGSTINVRYGRDAMREEIAQACGSVDAAAFDSYVEWLRRLYVVEMPNFIDRNFDSPLGLLSSPRALAELIRLGAFGRLGAAVRRRFADPRLHRLFSFQAMYAGLAPDSALALYAVITYMDSIDGVYFPEGGIHAVPTIMAQVAEKAGVTFRYGDAGGGDTALRRRAELPVCRRGRGHGLSPTPWCARLIFLLRTRSCSMIFVHRELYGAASTHHRQLCGTSACVGRRLPRWRTTTSTSHRSGARRSMPC